MKIRNVNQLNDFVGAVNKCEGMVWLRSPRGDIFNLKSTFSQYIGLGRLLSEQGDWLELFCSNKDDEKYFFTFFKRHPEVQC